MIIATEQRPLYEIKANLFRGLAHPYRIRILEILSAAAAAAAVSPSTETAEVSVTQMLVETGLEPSHLSQHLAVLRRDRLVLSERRASTVFYRLAFPEVAELLRVARQLLADVLDASQRQFLSVDSLPVIPSAAPGAGQ
ncbi:ArsR/SmtB family transcription factor [Rathayibacter soli]|uniref:ArsR/SmtB family transcription factor n=1 Tax=Rathayibacter soli TaxID=3144168 RepID=UPI0027E4D03D|nr:metalloregulator ArsR/SmtB family transcription factor [Glaciibacter superstes]